MREAGGPCKDGREERQTLVRNKELRGVGVEIGMQQLGRGGKKDLCVFHTEVIALGRNRGSGKQAQSNQGADTGPGQFSCRTLYNILSMT